MCNIDANSLVFYDYYEYHRRNSQTQQNSLNNLKSNDTGGKISASARKKIVRGVNLMHALSLPKIFYNQDTGKSSSVKTTLITTTLPSMQQHTDQQIKSKCLNRFLESLRSNFGMKSYLWRAESQKNGNIHFHIQTNIVAHHSKIRDIWNSAINTLGYVDLFEQSNGHRNPNSTDIHAIYKVKNLGAYVSKYMAKDNGYRAVKGRQWFLSQNLSKIKPLSLPYYGSLAQELDHYCDFNAKKFLQLEKANIAYASFFSDNLSAYPQLLEARNQYLKTNIPLIN